MFKGNKFALAIATVALIVAIIAVAPRFSGLFSDDLVGATPGSQLPIEQYVPAVLYNGGIYSTLPIQTTSDITGVTLNGTTGAFTNVTSTGSSTISGNLNISGSTTTIATSNTATSTLSVGCIQFPATSTATMSKIVPVISATSTIYGSAWGVLALVYGRCP